MERIAIGESGIETSRIGLGTWAIGGWQWGGTDEAQAVAAIRRAVEKGVTLIDTAPVYGFGRSEEIVGKAIDEAGLRDHVQIATKVALNWTAEGQPYRDSRPERLRQEIEDSLRRLRTDRIDLYQVHWPDPETPLDETAHTLGELKRQGKIRAIGVSNYAPDQMEAFRTEVRLDAVQPPYNLFEREIEGDVLPYAKETGLTMLCYGALCRGLLSGKMSKERAFEGDDLRQSDPKFQPGRFEKYLDAVAELDALARDRFDKSVLALAVRWILDQGPTIALWGARRPDQIETVDDVMGWTIDDETKADIDRILERHVPEPLAPEFMAPPLRSEAA